jgi:hypothetical protein
MVNRESGIVNRESESGIGNRESESGGVRVKKQTAMNNLIFISVTGIMMWAKRKKIIP